MTQRKTKAVVIGGLVVAITLLHLFTNDRYVYLHIFYRHLYYVPVILASFWFGIRGGLATWVGVIVLYPAYIVAREGTWSWTPGNFDRIMEFVVFLILAILLGSLLDREKAHQKALRESEALAAIGRAMAGVAHDMKTPLIAIGGFANQLKKRFEEDDPGRQKLEVVVRETARLESMVKEMLDFSRPLKLNLEQSDLNVLIRETAPMIEEVAKEHQVIVHMELATELPVVHFDRMRIEQALINLGVNAAQACPEGETVTIRSFLESDKVVLEVSDRGHGIPHEKKEEIFNPFFTTKKGGTGLGLAIVKKIIDAHDGRLELVSDVGEGATFRISLPINRSRPERPDKEPESEAS